MPSKEEEIRYIQDGADEIEKYLISTGTYGQALGYPGKDLTRLSLGGLLLIQKRVDGFNFPHTQRMRVEAANQRIAEARDRWRGHWQQKAERELKERLSLWSSYLADYFLDPGEYFQEYAQRVQWRVMVQLLEGEAAHPLNEVQQSLSGLDLRLQSALLPGPFIWESDVEKAFPVKEFWYLYGSLKATQL
ncbi:MAG: hypothetical protein M1281_09435 [Chloroflexi bacterium]|nr:hypothetical protein [Chloroflexota bacterium]